MTNPVVRKRLETFYQECGIPKPEPRARTKARADRLDAKKLKEFCLAVWRREGAKIPVVGRLGLALCQVCFKMLSPDPTMGVDHGEVHHRIGRRAKATRYDPDNGVLLCRECHGKAQRHEIDI